MGEGGDYLLVRDVGMRIVRMVGEGVLIDGEGVLIERFMLLFYGY